MCGIFGYIGSPEIKEAVKRVMEGIKKLDYRGYDSSGIAAISEGKLVFEKKVGSVSHLETAVKEKQWPSSLAIAHTRWATHGKPSVANAHPHFDKKNEIALVHNGIIENHEAMRRMLEKRGIDFQSETDTEVVSKLVGFLYEGDFLKAVQRAVMLLQGAFAIALIHKNHPDEIVCAAKECPLAVGIGKGEMFVSSDPSSFLCYTDRAIYLRSSEVALVRPHGVEVFDAKSDPVLKEWQQLQAPTCESDKGLFAHFMLKEINEQPQTTLYGMLSRYCEEYGTATLEGLNLTDEELLKIQRVVIVACGTSYHAGLIAAYMIEEKAGIPVQVEISSEYRYKNPIVQPHTLAIAISQSGETADTIAAMKELKEKGAKVIGICNAQGSTIAREADGCLFLRVGPEISVASTKAFLGQLIILSLLTLRLARMRQMSQKEGKEFIASLKKIPLQIKSILERSAEVQAIAKRFSSHQNFFFLGRKYMYPTALEGALKLKEVAYVNANGYPAGEMKHGPIALISEECPTIAFCADSHTFGKMLNNLMEIKARSGPIIAIVEEGTASLDHIADAIFTVPKTRDELAPILSTVVSQLFAYYFALECGTEIDKPRNLAKSVTVE